MIGFYTYVLNYYMVWIISSCVSKVHQEWNKLLWMGIKLRTTQQETSWCFSSAPAAAVRDAMPSGHWRPHQGQGLRKRVPRAHKSLSSDVSKWSKCGLVCECAGEPTSWFVWVCLTLMPCCPSRNIRAICSFRFSNSRYIWASNVWLNY